MIGIEARTEIKVRAGWQLVKNFQFFKLHIKAQKTCD